MVNCLFGFQLWAFTGVAYEDKSSANALGSGRMDFCVAPSNGSNDSAGIRVFENGRVGITWAASATRGGVIES